jgi:hypothetical protein
MMVCKVNGRYVIGVTEDDIQDLMDGSMLLGEAVLREIHTGAAEPFSFSLVPIESEQAFEEMVLEQNPLRPM